MKIILVRHAKAEHNFNKPDIKRKLSPKGKKDIRRNAGHLAKYLSTNDTIYCLTSSANRARQTAELIIEELEVLDFYIELSEDISLYHGDFDPVATQLSLMEQEDILIVVGHQPTMSYWAKELSDNYISFSTSEMACFEIEELSPIKAKFLWKIE